MTKEIVDSVIEAQAVALVAKNAEIKKLEDSLNSANRQIEVLQAKVDAGLYQNMVDQFQENLIEILDDGLETVDCDYVSHLGRDGDTINVRPDGSIHMKQSRLTLVEVSQDVLIGSTVASRELLEQVRRMSLDLLNRITAFGFKKLIFCRLPKPMPGTGALCASSTTKYGGRVLIAYNPNSLSNNLHIDVLLGGIKESE